MRGQGESGSAQLWLQPTESGLREADELVPGIATGGDIDGEHKVLPAHCDAGGRRFAGDRKIDLSRVRAWNVTRFGFSFAPVRKDRFFRGEYFLGRVAGGVKDVELDVSTLAFECAIRTGIVAGIHVCAEKSFDGDPKLREIGGKQCRTELLP